MATVHKGKYVAAAASTQVVTGAGRLLAILMSPTTTGGQSVTLYDNTAASGTVIFKHYTNINTAPVYIRFPPDEAIPFSTGLHAANPNVELNLWIVAN